MILLLFSISYLFLVSEKKKKKKKKNKQAISRMSQSPREVVELPEEGQKGQQFDVQAENENTILSFPSVQSFVDASVATTNPSLMVKGEHRAINYTILKASQTLVIDMNDDDHCMIKRGSMMAYRDGAMKFRTEGGGISRRIKAVLAGSRAPLARARTLQGNPVDRKSVV